ncbi:hypothetical protein PhaeoP66_03232 [Phaeobacter inhibens]|uniref:Uncharacterized protein n=1 Tax=Phaeobacter inhibens TaxID=221822 RepID=A0ABN5GSH9_9RHOB|nr:hypothetical protein [Phaeobacter inhibens]AUQ95974.1 hypothetical protein PhaeoP66_03232 [Phaeobacter inhibens]
MNLEKLIEDEREKIFARGVRVGKEIQRQREAALKGATVVMLMAGGFTAGICFAEWLI